MASRALPRRRVAQVERGYRKLLVPVISNAESERAIGIACRLAAERHASVTALTVIEIPPLLPLDAQMKDEEKDAQRLFARAETIGDAYGVTILSRRVRGRDAAAAILEHLETDDFEVVVIGARRRARTTRRAPTFGHTVQHVLQKATCRVLVVASLP